MSIHNKFLVRRFFEEIFNQANLAAADEIVSASYVNHNAAPTETPGREGLKLFVAYAHAGLHDLYITVDDQIAEGDKVVTRWTCTATHQGEFAGIPATGKSVTFTAINIHRVVDNRIQEGWLNWDTLGFIRQLEGNLS